MLFFILFYANQNINPIWSSKPVSLMFMNT